MKLKLGVENLAYVNPKNPAVTTTGEVAEKLEERYGVMRVFYEIDKKEIVADVVGRFQDVIESLSHGMAAEHAMKKLKVDDVEKMFRNYLAADTWQQTTGQVIMAAKLGINTRKMDIMNGTPRPAFIDTGLYESSFRAKII